MLTIESLIEWTRQGRRSVQVDISSQTDRCNITLWVYDFSVQQGRFVGMDDDLPTTDDLANQRRAELERQLKELAE